MSEIKRHVFFTLLPATHALRSEAAYTEKIDVNAPTAALVRSSRADEDLSWIQTVT